VSLSGSSNRLAVGGYGDACDYISCRGAVWVFRVTASGAFVQSNKLVGGDAPGGLQGFAVALSSTGRVIIAGAPGRVRTNDRGAAFIWRENKDGAWIQQGPITGMGDSAGSAFQGLWVATSGKGDVCALGGIPDDLGGTWVFRQQFIAT